MGATPLPLTCPPAGEELTITVTVHALADGQSRSVVQLCTGGPSGGGGHMECLEAFVCVVTPTCVVDKPVLDLGVTFVGVLVRQTLSMRNLSLLPVEYRWGVESGDPDASGPLADLRIKPDKGQLAPGACTCERARASARVRARTNVPLHAARACLCPAASGRPGRLLGVVPTH